MSDQSDSSSLPVRDRVAMQDAIRAGDTAKLRELLAAGLSKDAFLYMARFKQRYRPIDYAIQMQQEACAIVLVEAGSTLDPADYHHGGYGILERAITRRMTDLALLLIERGIHVDEKGSGAKAHPLALAAVYGDVRILAALLQRGLDPDACTCQDESPCERALLNAHYPAARMLYAAGSKVPAAFEWFEDGIRLLQADEDGLFLSDVAPWCPGFPDTVAVAAFGDLILGRIQVCDDIHLNDYEALGPECRDEVMARRMRGQIQAAEHPITARRTVAAAL